MDDSSDSCQNWRHDVVALIDADGGGMQVENLRYEAYGIPFLVVAGDVDVDGQRKTEDYTAIQNLIDTMGYDILADVDLDGDVDSTDKTIVQGLPVFGGGGRGVLSHPDDYNRKGYAGYEFDNTINHASYHIRHRVLNSTLGIWMNRPSRGNSLQISYAQVQPRQSSMPGECQSQCSQHTGEPKSQDRLACETGCALGHWGESCSICAVIFAYNPGLVDICTARCTLNQQPEPFVPVPFVPSPIPPVPPTVIPQGPENIPGPGGGDPGPDPGPGPEPNPDPTPGDPPIIIISCSSICELSYRRYTQDWQICKAGCECGMEESGSCEECCSFWSGSPWAQGICSYGCRCRPSMFLTPWVDCGKYWAPSPHVFPFPYPFGVE
jgi:hypothetical protein